MKSLILTLAAFLAALSAHAVPTYHISRTADGVTTDIPGATVYSGSVGSSVSLPQEPPFVIFGAFGPNGEAFPNGTPYFHHAFSLAGPESPQLYNLVWLFGPGGPATWYFNELNWPIKPVAPGPPPNLDYLEWPVLDSIRLPLLTESYSQDAGGYVWNHLATVVVEDLRRVRVPDQTSTFSLLAVAALGLVGFSRWRIRSV